MRFTVCHSRVSISSVLGGKNSKETRGGRAPDSPSGSDASRAEDFTATTLPPRRPTPIPPDPSLRLQPPSSHTLVIKLSLYTLLRYEKMGTGPRGYFMAQCGAGDNSGIRKPAGAAKAAETCR